MIFFNALIAKYKVQFRSKFGIRAEIGRSLSKIFELSVDRQDELFSEGKKLNRSTTYESRPFYMIHPPNWDWPNSWPNLVGLLAKLRFFEPPDSLLTESHDLGKKPKRDIFYLNNECSVAKRSWTIWVGWIWWTLLHFHWG